MGSKSLSPKSKYFNSHYDLSIFCDQLNASNYKCLKCGKIPNPYECYIHAECKKLICFDCYQAIQVCPNCKQIIDKKTASEPIISEISELQVKCQICAKKGNRWVGPLELHETHLERCDDYYAECSMRKKAESEALQLKAVILKFIKDKGIGSVKNPDSADTLVDYFNSVQNVSGKIKLVDANVLHSQVNQPYPLPIIYESDKTLDIIKKHKGKNCSKMIIICARAQHSHYYSPNTDNQVVIFDLSTKKKSALRVSNGCKHNLFWYEVVPCFDKIPYLITPIHDTRYSSITSLTEIRIYQANQENSLSYFMGLDGENYSRFCLSCNNFLLLENERKFYRFNANGKSHHLIPRPNIFVGNNSVSTFTTGCFNSTTIIGGFSGNNASEIAFWKLDLLDIEAGWTFMCNFSVPNSNFRAKNSLRQMFQLSQFDIGFLRNANYYPMTISSTALCETYPKVHCVCENISPFAIGNEYTEFSSTVVYSKGKITFSDMDFSLRKIPFQVTKPQK